MCFYGLGFSIAKQPLYSLNRFIYKILVIEENGIALITLGKVIEDNDEN